MSYQGHVAVIEFDGNDRIFFGRLVGIRDAVSFHADTVTELEAAFREAVDDYIETCAKIGKAPEKPYSGKMMFRVPPEVHARAALAAAVSGKSLNQWATEALSTAAEQGAARAVAV